MRRLRHLRPSGSRQSRLSGAVRAATSRPGERRHRVHRRAADPTRTRRWAMWRTSSRRSGWRSCPATLAIGHTRYSTAGDTVLLNAQPFSVACNKGRIAVAHNGNITNAAELRRDLERRRLHLPGLQRHGSDPAPGGALARAHAGRRAARSAAAARRRIFAGVPGAGPHHRGARSARFPSAGDRPDGAVGRQEAYVFASETCAFDLIGAVYLNDVEPGEMVIVGPGGHDARALCAGRRTRPVRLRARLLLAAGFHRLRPLRAGIARDAGPAAGARASGRRRHRGAGAGFGRAPRPSAIAAESRHPVPPRR